MTDRAVLRILYVTSTARIGGAERRALNLARYGDPERVQSSLLTLENEGPLISEAEDSGVPVEGWTVRHLFQPRLLSRMQRHLSREKIDIVHPYGLRAELLVRGPASRSGTRVISSICSVDPWRRWYHTALDRATLGGVSAWISNSEAGKRAAVAREKLPENRVAVVPTGIPDRPPVDTKGRAEARRNLGIGPENGPVLAIVANVRKAKGYEDLIEAITRLQARWPRLVCLCAGRDDSGGRIPALIRRRGLQDRVHILGFMEDPSTIYDAADLALLPSHWEGMPSALVEAMRAGLPSVATNVGGVPELIHSGEEGLLVDPADPAALAEGIETALSRPEQMAVWGKQARARYESFHRIESMVSRTFEIQEQIGKLKPPSS